MAKTEMAAQVARVTLVDGVNRIDIDTAKGDFIVEIDGVPLFDSTFINEVESIIEDSESLMDRYLRFSRASTNALAEGGLFDYEDSLCNNQITQLLFALYKNAQRC